MDRDRLSTHAEDLARGVADAGNDLVRVVLALQDQAAAQGIATRLASGERPCLTVRWLEDRTEVKVGLDGADDSPPVPLAEIAFARRA